MPKKVNISIIVDKIFVYNMLMSWINTTMGGGVLNNALISMFTSVWNKGEAMKILIKGEQINQ